MPVQQCVLRFSVPLLQRFQVELCNIENLYNSKLIQCSCRDFSCTCRVFESGFSLLHQRIWVTAHTHIHTHSPKDTQSTQSGTVHHTISLQSQQPYSPISRKSLQEKSVTLSLQRFSLLNNSLSVALKISTREQLCYCRGFQHYITSFCLALKISTRKEYNFAIVDFHCCQIHLL